MATKNKLVRYTSIEAQRVFAKEEELLRLVKANDLAEALLLWQVKSPTLILPAGKKWPVSAMLTEKLRESGWQLFSRKTGGAPVPQVPGIINLSHIYHWPAHQPYDIKQAYLRLCKTLDTFFARLGVNVDVHGTPGSYCDGEYNLNINQQKVVGTAQRVLLKPDAGRVVLAQACILIDADVDEIVKPVQLCNRICQRDEEIKPGVHTPLFAHIASRPGIDALYQQLTQAFLDAER
ncbi:lipoate--protein ligase [Vibrio sp. CAU 1672]|uniref:lipoate--protein ligase family protein n=1 Tax=Vibrio sp. CAU 1672 TaxID=3032594 RepID=UPI0023DA7792|nr:lipoate--protein ligase [Vibrio sp. CAU 1672]MDF2152941.1 lipoate--protein ligase [Vibrio sp. CAU 1672]